MPPTRTYRSLVLLDSFDEFTEKFKNAKRDVDLVNVKSEMKAFKDAYNHLIALTKTGISTLEKAQEAVLNSKKEKGGAQPAKKAKAEASFFEMAMEKGRQMAEVNVGGLPVPLDKIETPSILLNLPDFLWEEGEGTIGFPSTHP